MGGEYSGWRLWSLDRRFLSLLVRGGPRYYRRGHGGAQRSAEGIRARVGILCGMYRRLFHVKQSECRAPAGSALVQPERARIPP